MKELQNIIEWVSSFNRPEPECEALTEWLELENRAALRRVGRTICRIGLGSGFFVITVIAIALWAENAENPSYWLRVLAVYFATVCLAAFGPVVWARLRGGSRLKDGPPHLREGDSSRAIAQLRNIHGYRGLRRELGEHGVMELNEGAQLFLRCRSILTTAPWTSDSPENPWEEARRGLLRAMESAMDRLTLYVVKKRPFSDIGPVLDEMRTASNEIQRITEQRSAASGGAGRDLRASLARMKELAAAEDELLRVRD